MRERQIIVALVALLTLNRMCGAQIAVETVPVGNPGNPGQLSGLGAGGAGTDRVCGAVSYDYRIGKYEVTCGQFGAFLNAVAADDTYGLYQTGMWAAGSYKIERLGAPGSYTYSVAADWADRPIAGPSFWDACRFANWMHNGQPTGPQNAATTEGGAYTLNGYTGISGSQIQRNANARWAIPTEDEWYKAAYHKNDGVTANYWRYPTSSDTISNNRLLDPDPGGSANVYRSGTAIGSPYYYTIVGDYENSASPYGTYDQAGNVNEWTETLYASGVGWRVWRGSFFNWTEQHARAEYRDDHFEPSRESMVGFRLVEVPEPAGLLLMALGNLALLNCRRVPRQVRGPHDTR